MELGIERNVVPQPRVAPPCESLGPDVAARVDAPSAAAWIIRDVTHTPGVLTFDGGRLRFVSTGRTVFDATPADLGLTAALGRRGRFHVVVDGERVTLSVVRPSGGVAVPADLLDREAGPDATLGDADAAQRWRSLLAPAAPARTEPADAGVRRHLFRLVTALTPATVRPAATHERPMAGTTTSPMATA